MKIKSIYPQCLEEAGLQIVEQFITSNTHHRLKCLLCSNEFVATPKSKMANFNKHGMRGCPKCTTDNKFVDEKIAIREKLVELGFIVSEFRSKLDKVIATNTNCHCGRSWETKPTYLLTGRSFCRPCNDDKKRNRFNDLNEERFDLILKNQNGYDDYKKLVRHYTEQSYKRYYEIINPEKLERTHGETLDGYQLDHIVSLAFSYKNNIPPEICGHYTNLRMIPYDENIKKRDKNINNFPKIFDAYLPHRFKVQQFKDVLVAEFGNILELDFKVAGYTFDIKHKDILINLCLFNDNKESITLNRNNLLNISKLATINHMYFIPIFEHEWDVNKTLILAKLKHIFGINNSPKIYARKLAIKEISSKEAKQFLVLNHLQGSSNSEIRLGAFWGNKLVSLMTFSKPRIIMKKKFIDGEYELARFASDINYNVVGSASKLLNHFKKHYVWTQVYSFADKRWSRNGNLYKILGFEQHTDSRPNYFYIKDGKAHHRFKFAKHAIKKLFPKEFDETLSEYKNMLNLGYDRIWDCGNYKFVIKNK